MTVKIITDSAADISPEVASDLGITVVPISIKFGEETYQPGVDITNDEFYQKLENSPVLPEIVPPTPDDFVGIYSNSSKEAEAIISIHLSSKAGGIYDSALLGKWMLKGKCHIEVIDSTFTSVGLALVVMAAARLAREGASLLSVFDEAKKAIDQVSILGFSNTMKHLVQGGKINKGIASIAKILKRKPLLTCKNGEIVRTGLVGNVSDGIDKLCGFVERNYTTQDIAIAHNDLPEQAIRLKSRLGVIFPEEKIYVTPMGAALGIHSGQGALFVAHRRG
jgi:DegV family protein with EDD domain